MGILVIHNQTLLLLPFGTSAWKSLALSHLSSFDSAGLLWSCMVAGCWGSQWFWLGVLEEEVQGESGSDPAAALIIEDPIEMRSSC